MNALLHHRHAPAGLSLLCGFTSLSVEIAWVRLYSFTQLSTPAAFGFVLMAYLLGIALGAYAGSRQCRATPAPAALWPRCVAALWASAVLTVLLPWAFALLHHGGVNYALVDLLLIALASSVLAYVFPIAHHLGANHNAMRQGRHFARVYTANVAGAALGPLVMGYVLLDAMSLQRALLVLALLQCVGAAAFAHTHPAVRASRHHSAAAIALAATIAGLALLWALVPPHALMARAASTTLPLPHTVLENRHGVITLYAGEREDLVYGGNVYDGRTNLDAERNTNGLHRPLLLTALHPQPQRVLMLGLSIGSWLALVNGFEGVEHIDVLEINPGYLQAAQAYPPQARALQDPRVNLVAGDGRRWLRLHPQQHYDLIIMNTTWHWRSNSSLLLSREFLQLLRQQLRPGGIVAFNATGSVDALYTASVVFPHAYRYDNFVYAAEHDFRARKDSPQAHQRYAQLQVDGQPLFPAGSPAIARYLQQPFVSMAQLAPHLPRTPEVITDGNMITEFRYGWPLYTAQP